MGCLANARRLACAVLLLAACGRKDGDVERGDSAAQSVGAVTSSDAASLRSAALASDASGSAQDLARDASLPSAEEVASAIRDRGQLELLTNGDDGDDVQRTIRAHLKDVRGCYAHELTAHPKLAGKVVMHFTITTEGATRDVSSTRTGLDAVVATCIEKVVGSLQFPPPPMPRKVDFPFVFQQAN